MTTFPFEEPIDDNFKLWDSRRDSGPWAFVQADGNHAVLSRELADGLERRLDRNDCEGKRK